TDRVGNRGIGKTSQRNNIASRSTFYWNAIQSAEGHDLCRAAGFDDLAVHIQRVDRCVEVDPSAFDLAGQNTADEIVAVEQGDEEFEIGIGINVRLRHMLDNLFKLW